MCRLAVAAALLLQATFASAETARLDIAYSVYLTGLPVGRAAVNIDLNEAGFVVSGSAKSSGLIRLISKGNGSATVRGSLKANRVISSVFSGRYNSSRREQKIDLTVVNGIAKEISVEPKPAADNTRVPVTKEARMHVVDPLSAALTFVSTKSGTLSPEACNRTLPIFDGRYRFNIVLSYHRTENAAERIAGYQGPAIVCQARYVPIAGHRIDAESVTQMAANREMFVWLAPVSGTGLLVPVRASVSSPIGTFVVEATQIKTAAR